MNQLGNGLELARRHEDALSVREAELAMYRRLGASESEILEVQNNLANSYVKLGRFEEALPLRRVVYSGQLKLNGEEDRDTFMAANNYATSLFSLDRYAEAKSVLRKTIPVARRVLGENQDTALRTRWIYAMALYGDPAATLADLREAVTTLEGVERTARRVFGGEHPLTVSIGEALRYARAKLRARETPPRSA